VKSGKEEYKEGEEEEAPSTDMIINSGDI